MPNVAECELEITYAYSTRLETAMHCICVAFLWLRTAAPKLFAGTHCYFRSPTLGQVFGFLFWARLECIRIIQEPTIVGLCQLLPRFRRYWLVDNLGLGLVFFGSSPGTVARLLVSKPHFEKPLSQNTSTKHRFWDNIATGAFFGPLVAVVCWRLHEGLWSFRFLIWWVWLVWP